MSKFFTLRCDDKCDESASQQILSILETVHAKLMSRQSEQQREAVAWLFNELKTDSKISFDLIVDGLLNSKIITLLCDTILTMDGILITSTLECFVSLSTAEKFYKQNHASYVVASILRAGHFILLQELEKIKDKLLILGSIVRGLKKIFNGAVNLQIPAHELCDLEQIFIFLNKILIDENFTYRITFWSAEILSIVLCCILPDDISRESNLANIVLGVVETTLNLMCQVIEAKNPSDGRYAFRAIVMTCAICASGISSCTAVNRDSEDSVSKFSSYKAKLGGYIFSSMMNVVIPNFNKIELEKKYEQLYTWFVSSLNGIYEVKCCDFEKLCNYLAHQGYLNIFPRLTTFTKENLRNEILLLLSRILTSFAVSSLSAKTWLGGLKQFQRFLFNVLKSLPPDPSTWLSFLSEGDSRADGLLIFFYYHCLEGSHDSASYLSPIVNYVMSSSSFRAKRNPITIRKALWFTFCIAALSHENPSSIQSYDAAMTRLFNKLESGNLRQYYTHHPAVVIHCFHHSTKISDTLRINIVSLWLENEGDIDILVDGIIDRNLINYCLMEIVRTGSSETVDVAMKSISKFLINGNIERTEGLGNIVWELLPRTLAANCEKNVHNTSSLLKLAGVFQPEEISGLTLVRSLYQLIKFIVENESDSTLVPLGIKTAFCLLYLSIRRKDVQGVAMFTKDLRLIKILKDHAFGKEDVALSEKCFHCLSLIINYQGKFSIESEFSLKIELDDILEKLCTDHYMGSLKLVTSFFVRKIKKPIITLIHGSNEILRALYLQLHAIHAKSDPQSRNLSYALLFGLLSHCKMIGNFELLKNFCELPWTYLLIKNTIAEERIMNSHFITFVSKWLYYRYFVLPIPEPLNDRALCRDQFETILDIIAKAALTTFKNEPKREMLSELVKLLLLFDELIVKNIVAELIDISEKLNEN